MDDNDPMTLRGLLADKIAQVVTHVVLVISGDSLPPEENLTPKQVFGSLPLPGKAEDEE